MKLNKLAASILLIGLGTASTSQIFAACNQTESYKMNVVYAVQKDAKLDATQEIYKAKTMEILKNYLDIDISKMGENAQFEMEVLDRKTINKIKDDLLDTIKESFEKKEITEEQYQKAVKNANDAKKETYDKVYCCFTDKRIGDKVEGNYYCEFNGDTKELINLSVPGAPGFVKKGEEQTIDMEAAKDKLTKLIVNNKIAGIETPVCIESNNTGWPYAVFQDKNDATKQVRFHINPATNKIHQVDIKQIGDNLTKS